MMLTNYCTALFGSHTGSIMNQTTNVSYSFKEVKGNQRPTSSTKINPLGLSLSDADVP